MKLLCIDVGGTSVKHSIIESGLNICEKGIYNPGSENLDSYVESLGQLCDRYIGSVDGVAFSMPGIVDPKSGYFYTGGAYDRFIHEINLKDLLEKRIGKPISVENDAKAAGYAELGYGALKDVKDGIVITLGHAVGGCLIYNHEVVHGRHFSAGELSFINTDYHYADFETSLGYRCGADCLRKRVQEKLGSDIEYKGYEIFAMANDGNEKVLEALKEFVYELCVQLYNLQIVFDPELIALGGGISAQKLLYELIDECFLEMKGRMRFFVRKPQIVPCAFGNDANMIGAYHSFCLLHKDEEFKEKRGKANIIKKVRIKDDPDMKGYI